MQAASSLEKGCAKTNEESRKEAGNTKEQGGGKVIGIKRERVTTESIATRKGGTSINADNKKKKPRRDIMVI